MRILTRIRDVAGAFAIVAFLVTSASSAAAAPPAEMLRAFEEGRTLAKGGDYESAIKKFLEAIAIEPSVGALLNLGDCYERLGKPASARRRFLEAAKLAGPSDSARAQEAKARAASLERLVAWLVVTASSSPTKVALDGEVVAADGTRLPLDPGRHKIVATYPSGDVAQTLSLASGDTSTLRLAPPAPPDGKPREPPKTDEGWSGLQWAGVGMATVGVVGVGVGAVFAGLAATKHSDLTASCPDYPRCPVVLRSSIEPLYDEAHRDATVSTISFVAGGALVLGGAALFFVAPRRRVIAIAVPLAGGVGFQSALRW